MPNPTRFSDGAASRDAHAGRTLYPGEQVLWESRPAFLGIARKALFGDLLGAYFAVLLAIDFGSAVAGAAPWSTIVAPAASAVCVGALILVFASAVVRSTRYIVTTSRIILRFGAILPRSLSLPFSQVSALSMATSERGPGDIALRLRNPGVVRYFKLWPHVRPWAFSRPQPMLRGVPDAALLGTRLARLLAESEQAREPAATIAPAGVRSAA